MTNTDTIFLLLGPLAKCTSLESLLTLCRCHNAPVCTPRYPSAPLFFFFTSGSDSRRPNLRFCLPLKQSRRGKASVSRGDAILLHKYWLDFGVYTFYRSSFSSERTRGFSSSHVGTVKSCLMSTG